MLWIPHIDPVSWLQGMSVFPRQVPSSDAFIWPIIDNWALMKSYLSNPPTAGAVSIEVSVWLQGRGGDVMPDSGVMEEEEKRMVANWVWKGQNWGWKDKIQKQMHYTCVSLTLSSFCRLTDRMTGACIPQQSCSRAWGNTALQTCKEKHQGLINSLKEKYHETLWIKYQF